MTKITSIKGFDANLRCRGFQFEIGKTYTVEGDIKACKRGFHAHPVELHPLSVFEHYPPAGSRYFLVDQSGATDAKDNKLVSSILAVGVELTLSDLIQRAVEWSVSRGLGGDTDNGAATASGTYGAAQASGDRGVALASGDRGAAQASGESGAALASGAYGAAQASGWGGAALASGDRGAAQTSGTYGAAQASGKHGAAQASGWGGAALASGAYGAAQASGRYGAATASGKYSSAFASGPHGRVGGILGSSLHANEFDDRGVLISTACGIVGRDGIEPDTGYVCKGGKLVTVSE